jgi:hypothetical protein
MKRYSWLTALFLTLFAAGQGISGEPRCCEPPAEPFLQRVQPVGGWHPYGGGLLHWWNPDCSPHGGAPDDYCRKPLPRLCWPAWPACPTFGPPEICFPQCAGSRDCKLGK